MVDKNQLQNMHQQHMRRINSIHFIGIGGSGMNGIAEVMLNMDYQVSGSDIQSSKNVRRLENQGATIFIGHKESNVENADVVVKSTAIDENNPEIQQAHKLRKPVISRAEMLAEIMRYRLGIAVSGTHGKTTTTSILASMMADAGLDPTYVIGGILNRAGTSAKLGQGSYLIAEADESDASFLHLTPTITIVSNIDADHLETYGGDFGLYRKTFVKFLQRMPFYGLAVICMDDPQIRKLVDSIGRTTTTYGTTDDCDFVAKNINPKGLSMSFDVYISEERKSYPFLLNMPGKHNVLNALSCIAVGVEVGIPMSEIQEGIANFNGVDRRFTYRGEVSNQWLNNKSISVPVFEDYGHHPRELEAVLEAAKKSHPNQSIVGVFQPHRFSRTRDLLDDFANVLAKFDKLVLTRVYAAGEPHIPEADGKALARAIRARGRVEPVFIPSLEDIPLHIGPILDDDDVIIVMGAGNIGQIAVQLTTKKS